MKKMFYVLTVALLAILLNGCFFKGSSANPPTNFAAAAGDGRVVLTWDANPSVTYWIFSATDPALTPDNWTGLANPYSNTSANTPFYYCGLLDTDRYYFAANGRTNGGPGGASSPTIDAMPYVASNIWVAPAALSQNIFGVGYTSLTTCANNTTSAAGSFAAVGTGGAIFTSSDGITWTAQTAPLGFVSDLYAVTGYAASLNNPAAPGLLWVAVGAGGASVYSTDGITWLQGGASLVANNQALNSVTQVANTFTAVGDLGTVLSTTDGINWLSHTSTSATTSNLHGVAHGNIYVAVGDGGTIVTSGDGSSWTLQTAVASLTTNALRQVASLGSLIVAVGDGGTIVTSKDGGASWVVQTLPGNPALVGVAAESQLKLNDPVDGWLGVVPSVQFVAVDSSGNAYSTASSLTSANGLTWSGAVITGTSGLNALVSSGFGYVAAGNAGATAYAF